MILSTSVIQERIDALQGESLDLFVHMYIAVYVGMNKLENELSKIFRKHPLEINDSNENPSTLFFLLGFKFYF